MKKMLLIYLLSVAAVSAILLFIRANRSDAEKAVDEAHKIYQLKKNQETELSNGPCLSNEVIPDWVADIAHSPRTEADNLPENQCEAYRTGKAHHFVELDPNGKVIRAI